jgi:hypothetical protein
MKKILLFICIALSLNALSQPPEEKTKVIDETQVVKSGKEKFRIITVNEYVSQQLEKRFKSNAMLSINSSKKVNKKKGGIYWETSYYFENEDYNDVIAFLKNLKPVQKE